MGRARLSIPVTLMRGGTSKGVFITRSAFPGWDDPGRRDAIILRLMGTPDPMQIDGLGGTHSSTSKVVVVEPGHEAGIDLDYTFVQVGVDAPVADYKGNCGNLTSAVAPFGIHEGLAQAIEPVASVVLWNTNTRKRIVAEVQCRNGEVVEEGDAAIDGVPGTGAPIVTHWLEPEGTTTGKLFPTGRPRDTVSTSRGAIDVSIVDVTNPFVFVRAADLGLDGRELPTDLNRDAQLLERFEEIRRKAAVLGGIHGDEAAAGRSNLPAFALVSAPRDFVTVAGGTVPAARVDILVRVVSMRRVHHACAGTGAMCTSAAVRLVGTIPHEVAVVRQEDHVVLGHPKGVVGTDVHVGATASGAPTVASVSLARTARRLMRGEAFVHF